MKPYPNAMNYDSDIDYYLACINYCPEAVRAHYAERKKEAIKALYELSDLVGGLIEQFKFEYDIENDLNEHLDQIEKILEGADPIKCVDL